MKTIINTTLLLVSVSVNCWGNEQASSRVVDRYTGKIKFELGSSQASLLPKMAELLSQDPEWNKTNNENYELVIADSVNLVDGTSAIAKLFGEPSPLLRLKAADVFRGSSLRVMTPMYSSIRQLCVDPVNNQANQRRAVLRAAVSNFDRAIEVKQKGWQPFYEGTKSFVGGNKGTGYVKDMVQLSLELTNCKDGRTLVSTTEPISIKSISNDHSFDFFSSHIGMFYANFESRSMGLNHVKELGYEFLLAIMVMRLLDIPEHEQQTFFKQMSMQSSATEVIGVKGTYIPKRKVRHYFSRDDIRKSKCTLKEILKCKIIHSSNDLYAVRYYIQKAMQHALPSSEAQVKCTINKRKETVNCNATGDLNGFSSRRMLKYLRS